MISDQSCEHFWWNLDFIDNGTGLICSDCMYRWVIKDENGNLDSDTVEDLIQIIWQSTKKELSSQRLRLQEIEKLLIKKTNSNSCEFCDEWFENEEIFMINNSTSCVMHVGDLINQEFVTLRGRNRKINSVINKINEKYSGLEYFLIMEKILISNPNLESFFPIDYSNKLVPLSKSHKGVLNKISKKKEYTLTNLFTVLFKYFQFDEINERALKSYSFLLFIYSFKECEDICDIILPTDIKARIKISLSLVGEGLKRGDDFSIDITESLLEAVTHRCYDQINDDIKELNNKKKSKKSNIRTKMD